jgi:hypothetical protein
MAKAKNKSRPEDAANGEPIVAPAGEEWEDELFRQHNVFEKLVSETKKAKPSPDWRTELDSL